MPVKNTKSRGKRSVIGVPGKFEALGIIIYQTYIKVKPWGVIPNPVSEFDVSPKNDVIVPFDRELHYKMFCAYKGLDVHRVIRIDGELTKDSDPDLEECLFSTFSKITPHYLNKKFPAECPIEWPNTEPWMEIGEKYTMKVNMGCSEGPNLDGPATAWVHPEYHITLANPLPPR